MEKETISSVKVQSLVDFGKMIKKFKDNWLFLMEMSLMVVSEIIKDIKENIGTEMGTFMKELGKTMWRMVSENFIYKMGKNIKVSLSKVRNMDKEFIHGKMETGMKDSLLMIKDKV